MGRQKCAQELQANRSAKVPVLLLLRKASHPASPLGTPTEARQDSFELRIWPRLIEPSPPETGTLHPTPTPLLCSTDLGPTAGMQATHAASCRACARPLSTRPEHRGLRMPSSMGAARQVSARADPTRRNVLETTDVGNSTNIRWHESMVQREDKEMLLGQKGCVLWFTGEPRLPASAHPRRSSAPPARTSSLARRVRVGLSIKHPPCRRSERLWQEHGGVHSGAHPERARALHHPARR